MATGVGARLRPNGIGLEWGQIKRRREALDYSQTSLFPELGVRPPQLCPNTRHDYSGNSARHNQPKVGKISADVESKAVVGNPLLYVNPDAGNLAALSPDPGQTGADAGADAKASQCAHQRRLKSPKVPVQVLPVVPQVQDGISHQLTGSVEGDVATALDVVHSYSPAF